MSDVWDDTLGSDHFPVITSLGVIVPISPYCSHKYNLKTINWPKFSSFLSKFIKEKKLNVESPSSDPLVSYEIFVEGVDKAVLAACPPLKPIPPQGMGTYQTISLKNKPFVPAPWWDKSCDQAFPKGRRL